MLKKLIGAALLILTIGGPAAAADDPFRDCVKNERMMVETAVRNAKTLALAAAVSIGDTDVYGRWFGKYTPDNAERVRATLKAVYSAIRTGAVTTVCEPEREGDCDPGIYAYIQPNAPYLVHICPPFFELPNMAGLRPGQGASNNGTREGTVIHELSHFRIVGATDDNCYSRDYCAEMALRDAYAVVRNADSYQYYTEDITHFKPVPAVSADQ